MTIIEIKHYNPPEKQGESLIEFDKALTELDSILEVEGDTTEQEQKIVDYLQDGFAQKVAGWGYHIMKLKNAVKAKKLAIDYYQDQINQLKKESEVFSNKADRMSSMLIPIMQKHNTLKITTDQLELGIRKGSKSVQVDIEADQLKKDYQAIKISPDKKAIKTALEAGKEIKGCSLVTGKETLTLKGV